MHKHINGIGFRKKIFKKSKVDLYLQNCIRHRHLCLFYPHRHFHRWQTTKKWIEKFGAKLKLIKAMSNMENKSNSFNYTSNGTKFFLSSFIYLFLHLIFCMFLLWHCSVRIHTTVTIYFCIIFFSFFSHFVTLYVR